MEENLLLLQHEKDEAVGHNGDLTELMSELSRERDTLRNEVGQLEASFKERQEEFTEKMDEELKRKEEIKREIEIARQRIEVLEFEKKERDEFLLKSLDSIKSVKDNLVNIIECLYDEKMIERENSEMLELKLDQESRAVGEEITALAMLASKAEGKVIEYKEVKRKDMKELGNSVVSLTEEYRDINSLLRIALVEKEVIEKRLKDNSEQKRVALLQIAERGLQRIGFGFMMGNGNNEQTPDGSGANITAASNKSDGSKCEEEVVSLASTVEKIMKNLRLEITQLRKSLEESRSDTERLQSLSQKQAKTIEENVLYIIELEDRERVLAQNVEELLVEIKATEEDIARWRGACELEVEAGKSEIEERDKVQNISVGIMKQELEKTEAVLDVANSKLKLKEEIAAAAMAAQAAAETSLQLTNSRAAGLQDRIEELTKQLEEAESKERSRHKVRHVCWPWRALRLNISNNSNGRAQNIRRMLPEMQSLLHYNA